MTTVKFFKCDGILTGFEISGHSSENHKDFEGKIVCSAISSAAYLTANTLVEVIGVKIFTKVNDGYMYLKLESNFEEAQISLMGLELHLKELAKQYRKQISFISEV